MAIAAAAGAAVWAAIATRVPPPSPVAAPLIAARPEPSEVEPAVAKKPPDDDLTRSLRMLEDAERERRADEQKLQKREAEQRAAATLAREREEKARDARRHEAVKRELDSMSLASARRGVKITMYSTTWCGVCKQARSYMEARQIPFTELDVDRDAAASAKQHVLNPRGSVPTIAIDDEVLIGFSPAALEQRIDRAARRRTGS